MKKLLFVITAWCCSFGIQAQITPFEEWASNTGSQNFFVKSKTVTDDVNSVYTCGATLNSGGTYDAMVSKYNSSGDHLYTYTLNGYANNHDCATALAVDGSHNVYICGFVIDTLTDGSDIFITKLNSSFVMQWSQRLFGTGSFHDGATDIKLDASGNIYITGTVYNGSTTNMDVITAKYSNAGSWQWSTVFNNATSNLNDLGARIAEIKSGKMKVSIVSQTTDTTYAYGLKTYNTSNGSQAGTTNLGSNGSAIEEANAIAYDSNKNTYIAGAIDTGGNAGMNYCILKFDSTAALVYEVFYDANQMDDRAKGIAVNDDGYAYVTGYTTTSTQGTNYTTIKLDPNGNILWSKNFDKTNGADTAMAIVIHNDTTLVVTGTSFNGDNFDYYTIKYDTSGTTTYWEIPYNSHFNLNDRAYDLSLDSSNFIIVTGQSMLPDGTFNYTTVKYADPFITAILPDTIPLSSVNNFIENRGQLLSTDTLQIPGIKYYSTYGQYASYFTDTLISMVQAKYDSSGNSADTLHRVDMRFIAPHANAKVRAFDLKHDYSNFYLSHLDTTGLPNVPHYGKLYMKRLWNYIDLHITSNPGGVKYAFVMYPGFDDRDLEIEFDGEDTVYVNNNDSLIIETAIENIVFPKAKAYQVDSSGNYVTLNWQPDYKLTGDNMQFDSIGSYNTNLRLVFVIERDYPALGGGGPLDNLEWSTYWGGADTSRFRDVKNDASGNTYLVGYTNHASFPPISMVVSPFGGDYDAVLVKMNNIVEPQWVTFLGGTAGFNGNDANDYGTSLAVTSGGNSIHIGGETYSSNFFINDGGGMYYSDDNDTCVSGCRDAFIARFNAAGTLGWSTTFGDNDGNESVTDIALDNNNDLYAVGLRNANTDIVNWTGATNYASGNGMVLKFTTTNQIEWSNPFDVNYVWSMAADNIGNIYLTGETSVSGKQYNYDTSPTYSIMTTYNGGESDGYIAKFDANGVISYFMYLGGNCRDITHGVEVDLNRNVYVLGTSRNNSGNTCSVSTNIPVSGGYNLSGAMEAFLFKIAPHTTGNAVILYSGYYGGTQADEVISSMFIDFNDFSLAISNAGYLFISGSTISGPVSFTTAIQQPANQPIGFYVKDDLQSSGSYHDAFIAAFDLASMNLVWSTYFGGYDYDGATALSVSDFDNALYFVGVTRSKNDFIPNPGTDIELPIWEFDPNLANQNDYFQPSVGLSSTNSPAWAARFNLDGIDMPSTVTETTSNGNTFGLYPNPNNGNFTLVLPSGLKDNVKIDIHDVRGRLIFTNTDKVSTGQIQLNLENIETGMYLVTIETTDETVTLRLVKN